MTECSSFWRVASVFILIQYHMGVTINTMGGGTFFKVGGTSAIKTLYKFLVV